MGIDERWKGTKPIKLTTKGAIDEILPLFSDDERIEALYLFGSRVRDEGPSSKDLDLAFYTGKDFTWEDFLSLYSEITIKLKSDRVDLVWLNKADPIISFEVVTGGRLLYAKDLDEVEKFETKTRLNFYDYKIYLKKHIEHRKDGI